MTQVVDRVGALLGAFATLGPELALPDFVNATGLHKSSAHRLLVALEEAGLVERRGSVWRPGPLTVTLADLRLGGMDLRAEALPHLRDLRRTFKSAVAFSMPDGVEMVYLERLDSPDAFGVSARLGARAPMWSGGSGKAVLAALDPEERSRLLDHDDWRRIPRDVRDRVLTAVADAVESGYAVDDGQFFSGVGGVAVAIRDAAGQPTAALSVIVTADQLDDDFVRSVAARLELARIDIETNMYCRSRAHDGPRDPVAVPTRDEVHAPG